MHKVRVFIVDDSAVVRDAIAQILGADPGLEVIGTAADPVFALRKMEAQWPDVITLDLEMPRMDGLTFLRKLMAEHPTPVVICSSIAEAGSRTAMDALHAGAMDIITKPKIGVRDFLRESASNLIHVVKAAARSNLGKWQANRGAPVAARPRLNADAMVPANGGRVLHRTTERIVAIGTSTGGTQALEVVLTALPRTAPGILVVQHMPEHFTSAFAARLNSLCQIEVREAEDNDRVLPGRALIARGGRHLLLGRSGAQYIVHVRDGPLVSRHRPSVDVLFRSVARTAGANALGVIMTGMGDDGAAGMREMHEAGARTVAQDEVTCVVYGMPKEAVARGGVDRVVPLHHIAEAIMERARETA